MYKIVGADKKEYGPVSGEQLHSWIKQGRANSQTLVSFEGGPWKPLTTFQEFATALRPQPPLSTSAFAVPGRKNSFAVIGLVFSILGLACCPGAASIVGIVCGAIAFSQIRDNPQRYSTGKNVALAAVIIGCIGILVNIGLYTSGKWDMLYKNFGPR